ncbi:hypothetical protein CIN_19800 [Commensalibacter intestini A911]|uniref:NAD(P)-binding domain-containing protein n=1 Tax=Commensalibacter intestini A911 TaxID=1088868 RepID=G6F2Y4_9PROT|nr:SDR family NAD(P)-dependent oxidoreductase [Commensalibacter intestini]EHD12997.1 hypothetical protein CIN_19800 [Commensalibacter intestini A911]
MVFLVTGAGGFIGFHLSKALLARGEKVIGLDNLNDYYSPSLKQARCEQLKQSQHFSFYHADITDQTAMEQIVQQHSDIQFIFNLAAQAGVRYSLDNPFAYIQTNVMGQVSILEMARRLPKLQRIFYASSSSVYGLNKKLPFSETDRVDRPSSVYAASKQSAELLSFTYNHLYGLKQTGLRFFTVYGPWGRPDMAYYLFAKAIIADKPITLYTGQNLSRDFTYISDVIDALLSLLDSATLEDYGIFNIGNSCQEKVESLVICLEENLGKKAVINYVERPETDIEATLSDINAIYKATGWTPKTKLSDGIRQFVDWFQNLGGDCSYR